MDFNQNDQNSFEQQPAQGNGNFEWHGFGKFWLWFCFIVNIIVLVIYLISVVGSLALGGLGLVLILLCIVAEVAIITGLSMLLFKKKKIGFYITCGTAVFNCILNIANGNAVQGIFSAVVSTLILYLAIKNNWDQLG